MLQLKKIFILFLSFFLLLSSMGVSLEKMVCLSSGKVKVALFEAKDCCPEEEAVPDGIKSRCCDFVKEFVQVDYLSVKKPLELNKFQLAVVASFCKEFFPLTKTISLEAYSDKPPLPSGYFLLKLIGIFRI